MRKIQLFVLSVVVVLFTACHGNLWDAIEDLDARVARLEELCKEMNTNITSLQTIVSVIQENDVITGITPIEKGGKVIGYTITFDKHEPITIYNGEDGKDGANGVDGKDGYTPILGVAKDTDGVYYWTLDGEWLLDAEGNKLRVTGRDGKDGVDGEDGKDGADGKDGEDGKDGQDGTNGTNGMDGKDGVTPQLKIEEGYWYISYDNGATWAELGKAVGEDGKDGQDGKPGADGKDGKDGDSMFTKVTYDEKNVYLTLTNGTVLTIPLGEGVWEALEGLEERIAKLEALCKEMNTNISALQTIVSALQSNDYITAVVPVEKEGKVIGYTITFGKHDPITIYNGEDGKDGANGLDGKDGYTPILGVAKDTDGVYYWTLDGEWLLDADGNKLCVTGRDGKDGQDGQDGKDGVDGEDGKDGQDGTNGTNGADGKDGVTPQLKIENGYWYISYDKGATWTELGKAVGEDGKDGVDGEDGKDGKPGADGKDGQNGDSMFTSVTYDENNVYFTLTDGSVLIVPRENSTSDFDQTVIDNLVTSLELDKDTILLDIGEKATIVATTAPFSNSKVTWSSSDETIAKVENGEVEAISAGLVIISAQAGTLTKKCYVFAGVNDKYVDLGLSVKWATCNIGANSPEEYGDYFAWGEVEPKEYYDWSTYKHGSRYDLLEKYCNNSNYGLYGFTDKKIVLDPEDDAAYINWGGVWRMPTKEEQEELVKNCVCILITLNGVNGVKIIGPNGNFIFLPAAGFKYDDDVSFSSRYWLSSYDGEEYSVCMFLPSNSKGQLSMQHDFRDNGMVIRPVCE